MQQNGITSQDPIQFTTRLTQSAAFNRLYDEGMLLVEAVSAYLDGVGRRECQALTRIDAISYASESMRLTTRLMQLASWLLLQRAINEGEMSAQLADSEKEKIRFENLAIAPPASIMQQLPHMLQDYIVKAQRLQERIMHLDQTRDAPTLNHAPSPVSANLALLENAFSRQ
jgi:regulator of CtrA degradation